MMFITRLFAIASLASVACTAHFFNSHPIVASVVKECMNVLVNSITLFTKLVSTISNQTPPNLTEDELLITGVIVALFVIIMWSTSSKKVYTTKVSKLNKDVKYANRDEALESLCKAIPDGANVIVNDDITGSNWFRCNLHPLTGFNPYKMIRTSVVELLVEIDSDKKVLYYYFGSGKGEYVQNYFPDGQAHSLDECNRQYDSVIPGVTPGSYTCFEAVVQNAIDLYKKTRQHTICVINGDGALSPNKIYNTLKAAREAAVYPIMFIFLGVGNPSNPKEHWKLMNLLDNMEDRIVDNWQTCIVEECASEDQLPLIAVAEICSHVKNYNLKRKEIFDRLDAKDREKCMDYDIGELLAFQSKKR